MIRALCLVVSLLACSAVGQDGYKQADPCPGGYTRERGDSIILVDCEPDPRYWELMYAVTLRSGDTLCLADKGSVYQFQGPGLSYGIAETWVRRPDMWTRQIVEKCDTVEVWKKIYIPGPILVRAVGDIRCRQDTLWRAKR